MEPSPLRFAPVNVAAPTLPPLRASDLAAGFDLRAAEDRRLPPGGAATLVRTGIALALPTDSVGIIKSRSSLAARHDIEVGAGVIDADYRGEVSVLLRNFGTSAYDVREGDRIGQLVVLPLQPLGPPRQESMAQLGETQRGAGGFGSTGRA
jgi:deoxyuridine 5'-triphosphate nucleotidohydrolase